MSFRDPFDFCFHLFPIPSTHPFFVYSSQGQWADNRDNLIIVIDCSPSMFQLADDDDDFPFQKAIKVRTITNLYTLLIIPEMWRQLVKYKEGFCLVLNRNKDSFTN